MASPLALVWDLIAKDSASPAFLRVAGAADKAAGSTLRAQKNVEGAAAGMSRVGAKLTKGLTVPLLGIGAVAVEQAARFQKGLNTVAVATDKTAAQTAAAGKGLESIAKSTGTSLSQLTDSYYTAAKSGKSVSDSLAIVKAASQGAKAEGADLGTVTNALTSIMASYGKSLGTPVQAMNAIVRGAGLAKTNIGDFSASLANVVPIASALHISFAQVAGAIDTMTQHGETAQRATENLGNLITNLAGQNAVASKSLQSLGVDTVDLSKNLGARGLTGSLGVVFAAIDKHGKDGLVVTSAFKQAALASSALQTELKAMPPALKAQSEAFDKGSISYKDYNAYVKSLGGQQYQLGKGFITTEAQAKGFNSQLSSGNGNVRTLASTLQKALGGVTGMRTALMLSGQSAQTFAADTAAVSAASKRAGGDVLGWSTTQGTLAVKLDKAKESLQVMAVEIGTALLPVVSKIVDAVSKAVGWFDSLSSGDKKFLLWSAGILAAVGPVLSIFARLATVIRLLPGLFATAAASAGGMATRTGAALTGVSKAVAGIQAAAGGYFAGSYAAGAASGHLGTGNTFRKGSGTVLAGAAGGALAGAAIGAIGGPLGAAAGGIVGGLAGTVGGVVTAFHHMNDAANNAKKAAASALAAQNANARDLLATLQSINGAYNEQYKQTVVSKLHDSGALQIGDKAGLAAGSLTNAVLGVGGPKQLAALNVQLENAASRGQISFTELSKVQGVIGTLGASATKAETSLEQQNRELGRSALTSDQLGTSLGKLKAAFVGGVGVLDTQTAAGKRNNAVLAQNITTLNASAAAQLRAKVPAENVAKTYLRQIDALERNSVALGANKGDVESLIGRYAKVPKNVVTALRQLGISTINPALLGLLGLYQRVPARKSTTVSIVDRASGTLTSIRQAVDNLQSKTITITTRHTTADGGVSVATNRFGLATGGTAPEGYFSVGEEGPEIVRKRGSRVDVMSNSMSRAFIAATGARFPGFAAGTGSTKKPPVRITVGGTVYTSSTGAANARTRLEVALDKAGTALAVVAGKVKATSDQLLSAAQALAARAKADGLSAAAQKRLAAIAKVITTVAGRRNADAARVTDLTAKRTDLASQIKAATAGAFDISTAGASPTSGAVTLGGILAQGRQQEVIAQRFAAGLQRLRKGGLSLATVTQLAQAGPGAFPQVQALLKATPAQLRTLNADQAGIARAGGSLGSFIGGQTFNGQISAAQVAEKKENALLRNELRLLRLQLARDEHRKIDVKIDGKKAQTALSSAANKNKRRQ